MSNPVHCSKHEGWFYHAFKRRDRFSKEIDSCATRYVLNDELTRICTALAYSKGAATLDCANLLHVPAERVWVEWAEAPWLNELARYGFKSPVNAAHSGRTGVFIQSLPKDATAY
jgi:hypothetical protein